MGHRQYKRFNARTLCVAVSLQVLVLLTSTLIAEPTASTFGSSPSSVSADGSQVLLQVGMSQVALQPGQQLSLGRLLTVQKLWPQRLGTHRESPVATWAFDNGSIEIMSRPVPNGVFLNLTLQVNQNCSCGTDAALTIIPNRLADNVDSVITSTTPLSKVAPPQQTQVLIEAMDYDAVEHLYGVAAAFVLKTGSTSEIVSLYPFTSISYNPLQNGEINIVFRKGLGDLSTSSFESGDSKSIMFYIGSANVQETTGHAFMAFADDVEVAFPARKFGKPFFAYAADGGSWDDLLREAESLGYTLVSNDDDDRIQTGGGYYFSMSTDVMDRITTAGLNSALVLRKDGTIKTAGGGLVRMNPSVPGVRSWFRRDIDSFVNRRDWFFADTADVVQDFDPRHSNVLEGYMQILSYVRSTGRGIVYNSYHTPHLWLDWLADGALIEMPTGQYLDLEGTRDDYLASGNFFDVTREFMRIHSKFFPGRMTVWQDPVSLEDSTVLDSIAFFLMEGASSFSFSTNKMSCRVKPGEITKGANLLAKMDSIRMLSLGSMRARSFTYEEQNRSWTFQALTAGSVSWHGKVDSVFVNGAPVNVTFDGQSSTFYLVAGSQVTLLPQA